MSLEKIRKEYDELLNQLSNPELVSDWEKFEELSKRKKELDKIIDKSKQIEEIDKNILENKTMLADDEDQELSSLAETESVQLQEEKKELDKELDDLLKGGGGEKKSSAAIIEIRAGTGGDEATLFAANLYKMYSRYADSMNWKQKVLDSSPNELGGFKEIVFELKPNVFDDMKYEAGVHRVQRTPETEKSGRIHTSTATVAVLPKPKSKEIDIKTSDLKIDHFRSSGPGGQNVNKRETAIRITHIPSGLVVTSQTERNQLSNKENALSILSARLLEKREQATVGSIDSKRKEQIGGAKRSEKIRTYNFPQDRVTDHRIKKSWHGIEAIMDGGLDKIIKTLKEELEG